MKKILPKQLRFFLADGVREEIGAKISLIGLYTGDEVIVQSELPVQVPGKIRGLALPGLYILIILVNGQGKFKGEFVIYDPNGKPMRRAIEIVNKVKDKTFNVILQGLEIGKVLGVLGRCKSHAVSLSAGTLYARIDGVFDPVVALFL